MNNRQAFWIVWSPTGPTNPSRRHESASDAERESVRLARTHAGSEFYVMKSESVAKRTDVSVEYLRDESEMPF